MSNIFVNRNRSQGDYGMPLNKQKFKENNQKWYDRGDLPTDQFHKTSNKYNKKYDYNDKYVGVGWTLKQDQAGAQNLNLINKDIPQISNAQNSQWKFFNTYERQDFQKATQDALKAEISNITAKIVAQRENKMNSTYQEGMTNYGNWRVPETEIMDRTFNETARYHTTTTAPRKHGLKYVPPPKAENLQQLVEDQMKHDNKSPNFLLNARYSRGPRFGSRANSLAGKHEDNVIDDTKSIVSMLSGHKRVTSYNIAPSTAQNKKRKALELADIIDPEKLQKLNKTSLGTTVDRPKSPNSELSERAYNLMSQKQKKEQILKNYKGQFFFPRRRRFNEDVAAEVTSQRSGSLIKALAPLNRKNLVTKLDGSGDNASYHTIGGQTKTSSQKKNMTVSELSIYFKKKEFDAKSRLDITKSACANYASPLGKTGYAQKFLKRAPDMGNPRYAASKASTHIGNLITGLHTTHALPAHLPDEDEDLKMTAEDNAILQKVDKDFIDDIENRLLEQGDIEDEQEDQDNEDEMTFAGENESVFFGKLKGAQTNNYTDDGDAITVATSAIDRVSVFSGANTSQYSRKYQEVADKLFQEKKNRQDLETKIKKMKEESEMNQKLLEMQMSNDQTVKMMKTEQRNCMQSAQNYQTHPDV